ncbi:MAG: trypsin-like peptidase domain-containing protein [Candidatus Rokuibacteriota bacterium]
MTSPVFAAERAQPPASFAPVADAVKAAVFSVVLPSEDADDGGFGTEGPAARDLLQQLFEALGGVPNRTLGAAVMLDPGGIAVTGARILQGLTEVEVVAVDGARYRATVLGRDDRSDIAVLRVIAPGPLPAARLGDSDEMRVGDWVLAVGSPYGFEASVSAGIVSSRTRIAAGGAYGDLLQTDAAINPGSAGGPLVNARGEVVGLSSTAAPREVGVGFAAPSNLVRRVVDDIVAHGRVVRGWLGIAAQPLTAELGDAFRVPFARGLLLADVTPGGPAATAGLTRGTILVALERRSLGTLTDLEDVLAVILPGRLVTLDLWRNGRQETIRLALGQEPAPAAGREPTRVVWGLAVDTVTPETGVVVTSVRPGSPAANAGLRRGDLVREFDRRIIRNLADFDEASAGVEPGQSITLLVQRNRAPSYVVLVPDR